MADGFATPRVGAGFARHRMGDGWPTATALVLGAGLWEGLGRLHLTPLIPPVTGVLSALGRMVATGELQKNLSLSLLSLALGYGAAAVVGVVLGVAMGYDRRVEALFDMYVNAFLAAPSAAFVPLMVVFFGLGQGPVAATVFIFSCFVIVVNTCTGVKQVDRSVLEMARAFCAGRRLVFWRILLPGALPMIMAGLRLGAGRAVKGLVVGEALISLVGLGGALQLYGGAFQVESVYALVLVLVAISLGATAAIKLVERRLSSWPAGRERL